MARNPAQSMSGYGVASSVAPVAIVTSSPSSSTAMVLANLPRPPGDIRNPRAYAHWLASGGRRRHHRASLSGALSGALSGVFGFLGFGHGGGHGHHGHGRRRRWGRGWGPGYFPGYYDSGDPSTICVIDPRTGIQTCMPAQSASMLMPSQPSGNQWVDPYMASQGISLHAAAVPPKAGWGRYGAPGGFQVASIGSSTRPTAGFHDYGYADAFGAFDPAQLLEANSAADSGTKQSQDLAETIRALSPAITTVVDSISDPYKRVKILKAKIKDAKQHGASASRIRKLQAKLDAAQHRLDIKNEALDSTRDWRMLGKAGIVTGIGVGAAIIFFIFMQSFKPRKAHALAVA